MSPCTGKSVIQKRKLNYSEPSLFYFLTKLSGDSVTVPIKTST